MNSFLPKPVLLKELKETLNSKEISEKTTCLDKISNNSDMRPFLLFANDVEVADDDNSLTCASDTENSQRQFTCLIAEGLSEVITTISRCVERRGWRTRVTRDGVEALQLMKMRNWDAIFIDENLCKLNGNSCVSIFRQWEATNRVAKQRNIHLVSAEFNNSNKRVPLGCDGALGTHFSQNEIVAVLKVGEKHQRTPTIL
jgi:CheY-like chemotaxis protein